MSVTDKKQNDLLEELIEHHNQILACEMQIDQLSEQKRGLIASYFDLVGEEEHDEVAGLVVVYKDDAYVIHLRKEDEEDDRPAHFNADIQKMKLIQP